MNKLIIRDVSALQAYEPVWEAMRQLTDQRNANTNDEVWLMEHYPVFTQGQAGKPEHVLNPHNIPIVQCDRGGQVTYHGPGQLMIYTLIDIKRLNLNTRNFVRQLEQLIVNYLSSYDVSAKNKIDAPGVYVNDAKICSIGLRVRKGFSYHGLAFNINMDLTPFSYINPCGFKGLAMAQVRDFKPEITISTVKQAIIPYIKEIFGYNHCEIIQSNSLETLQDVKQTSTL